MGITIHYKGTFHPKANLAAMIEEVKDIAEVNKWEYHIFEKEFPAIGSEPKAGERKKYGIYLTPPNCETITLTFRANGTTDGYHFTKTQFAGSAMHIIVINLLRYISKKYFIDFEVEDEGDYWQTNDEVLLQKHMNNVGLMIKTMKQAFENIPKEKGEKVMPYVLRVAETAAKKYNAKQSRKKK